MAVVISGRLKFFRNEDCDMSLHYLLGLFEGDGYQRTGTFGVTNRNEKILQKAAEILSQFGTVKWKRDKQGLLRVCITSRPAKRHFLDIMQEIKESLNGENLPFYFAGKFDADGSVWKTRDRLKITYGIKDPIELDQRFLMSIGISSKIRKYKNRNAFDLEISSNSARKFTQIVKPFSVKMSS